MPVQRRRIAPEGVIGAVGEPRDQRVVLQPKQRRLQRVDVSARKPEAADAILDLLAAGANVGDDDRRAHGLGLQHGERLALVPERGERQRPRRAHLGAHAIRRQPAEKAGLRIARPQFIGDRPVADERRPQTGARRRLGEQKGALLGREPPDENHIARGRIALAPEVLAIDRIGDTVQPRALGQIGADDLLLIIGDADIVRENLWQPREALRHGEPGVAPQLARIIAAVAMGRPAGGRQRRAMADLIGLIIIKAAIGTEQEIFVQCVERRQAGGADRRGDGRRQRLGPAMNMHDRLVPWQPRQQIGERAGRGEIPSSLHGGGGARGIAEEVMLIEADHFDAGLGQALVDGRGGGE